VDRYQRRLRHCGGVRSYNRVVSHGRDASLPITPTVVQSGNEAPARLAAIGGTNEPAPTVRGITDSEIRFGISAPFTGPAKELGQSMKQCDFRTISCFDAPFLLLAKGMH